MALSLCRKCLPIDTTVDIVTPENIAFHYQVAGPFRRFPAYVIDVLLRMALLLVVAMAPFIVDRHRRRGGGDSGSLPSLC